MHIRKLVAAAILLAGTAVASTAHAKEYVDYGYGKGIWTVNQVEVDPNHIDDYLTGLKASEIPAFEIMKRKGMIDDYGISVRQGYTKGVANIVIMLHFTSAQMMMPDPARDQALDKEISATFSEAQDKQAIAAYEKYRTFLDNGAWIDVKFNK